MPRSAEMSAFDPAERQPPQHVGLAWREILSVIVGAVQPADHHRSDEGAAGANLLGRHTRAAWPDGASVRAAGIPSLHPRTVRTDAHRLARKPLARTAGARLEPWRGLRSGFELPMGAALQVGAIGPRHPRAERRGLSRVSRTPRPGDSIIDDVLRGMGMATAWCALMCVQVATVQRVMSWQGGTRMRAGKGRGVLPLVGLVVASCHPMRGCAESHFELADESRVPKWFVAEAGQDRTQSEVTMTYWIGPSGRSATFELRGPGGKVRSVVGTQYGDAPLTISPTAPGMPPGYPSFEVVTAEGMTEIIEHKSYSTEFYINDDPAVREALQRQVGRPLQ